MSRKFTDCPTGELHQRFPAGASLPPTIPRAATGTCTRILRSPHPRHRIRSPFRGPPAQAWAQDPGAVRPSVHPTQKLVLQGRDPAAAAAAGNTHHPRWNKRGSPESHPGKRRAEGTRGGHRALHARRKRCGAARLRRAGPAQPVRTAAAVQGAARHPRPDARGLRWPVGSAGPRRVTSTTQA